ncbi:hypothetical protein PtA15_10A12 [Puccinia triticina]|uniref:RNA-dependent RNA polymerase n=1 Tax=Puccinia triticina TaxID=208348 RepID=A0ABY7CUK4_9BASI|nr:uncharacterized protein PtA15_10A12 [Puccinia triticina]WAQ88593.1 hypothetical protein PtA15_10A12 [Puccinia triticina]
MAAAITPVDFISETVILPNHPAFEQTPLPWSHLFEIARLYQVFSEEKRAGIDLARWVSVAAKTNNPADLQDLLLSKHGKANQLARIGGAFKELFRRTEEEEASLPALQKLVGGWLSLDFKKGNIIVPRLNPPDLPRANQLNRTYGADRFIHLRLTDQLCSRLRPRAPKKTSIQKNFIDFIHAPLRIGNRLFYFFLRKESCLWMVASKEPGWESTKSFINEILDLGINKDMTVAKWAARTSLLLSATQASINIDAENIRRVPDLYSDSLIISEEFLSSVANGLRLDYVPTCIEGQVRNKTLVWRLGVPDEAKKNCVIQLWEDQIGKATTHLFIKFRARSYDYVEKTFVPVEESVSLLIENCVNMGTRPPGKPEIMTDGAGIISRAAASLVCEFFGRKYDTLPSAYQARIGFAKGLWILPPVFRLLDSDIPWVEIRDSQWKAETVAGYPFHFNLCRISRPVSSSTLGKQLLPILSARGVRTETICSALEEHVQSAINDLNSSDPLRLTEFLTRSGALKSGRRIILNRLAGVEHDPAAYRTYGKGTAESHPAEYVESWAFTTDYLHNMSLVPFQTEEAIVSMLAAGFEPKNRFIVTRLRKIKEEKISIATKFKVPIPQSTYIYAVPDPTGTLKEDEAFLQFSSFEDQTTGIKISTLICPAIVSRSPCVGSIDARKINLVDNNILRDTYFDVLVCSIQGKASLLSLLSGGDYDGDQVTVVWDSAIVQQFNNINLEKNPRVNIDDLFEPVQLGTIKECLLDSYQNDSKEFVKTAQIIQAAGLFTPNDAGAYSIKHTMTEYVLGLDHPLTQKMGEVYVKCLDAPKAGTQLKAKSDVLLKKEYDNALSKVQFPNGTKIIHFPVKRYPIPKYLSGDPKFSFNGAARSIRFELGGKPHVLDKILAVGLKLLKNYKDELDQKDISTHKQRFLDQDKDLSEYFLEHKRMFEFNKTDEGSREVWIGVLLPLQREISAIAKQWAKVVVEGTNSNVRDRIWESEYGPGTGASGKGCKIAFSVQKRYDEFSYSKAFEYLPATEELERNNTDVEKVKMYAGLFLRGLGPNGYALLKASCLSSSSNPESFCPYDIAFREICYLKAMAKKKNSKQGVLDCMSFRPPSSIVTTAYLTNVVKKGTILGRSKNLDQNLAPI